MHFTISDLKELIGNKTSNSEHPYHIGKSYFIRTVTMIYTGRLIAVYDQELVIEDVAWIPETEIWSEGLKNGTFKECQPYLDGPVVIGRGAILDASEWKHELPRTEK